MFRGRRRDVLRLLADTDQSVPEIANALGMKIHTARDHVRHIYRFLEIQNRSQLVRIYLDASLCPPSEASPEEITSEATLGHKGENGAVAS